MSLDRRSRLLQPIRREGPRLARPARAAAEKAYPAPGRYDILHARELEDRANLALRDRIFWQRLFAPRARPSGPFIRQAHLGPMNSVGTATATYIAYLQHPTLAGNAVSIKIEANSSDTISSIVDDAPGGSNTWAQVDTQSASQSGHVWLATNVKAGTQKFTITLNQVDNFVQILLVEISGVSILAVASALDGATAKATTVTGTTISAGTLANVTGSLLFQFAYDVNQQGALNVTAGSGWTLLAAQKLTGFVCQYKVATGANETASFTRAAGTRTFNTIAFAIKADAAQGDATQTWPFVRFVQSHYAAPGAGPAFALQFPCQGDLLASVIWQGDSAKSVSSVLDSVNGSWPPALTTANVANGQIEGWSAGHCSTSTSLTLTVTYSAAISAAASGIIALLDIVGSNISPIGNLGTGKTGNQTSASTPFNVSTVSITPSATNSLIVAGVIINSHCVAGLTGGPGWNPAIQTSSDFNGGDQDLYDCDGVGTWRNGASLSSGQFTWSTFNSDASGVGTWGAIAFEIKSAPAATVFTTGLRDDRIYGTKPFGAGGRWAEPRGPLLRGSRQGLDRPRAARARRRRLDGEAADLPRAARLARQVPLARPTLHR